MWNSDYFICSHCIHCRRLVERHTAGGWVVEDSQKRLINRVLNFVLLSRASSLTFCEESKKYQWFLMKSKIGPTLESRHSLLKTLLASIVKLMNEHCYSKHCWGVNEQNSIVKLCRCRCLGSQNAKGRSLQPSEILGFFNLRILLQSLYAMQTDSKSRSRYWAQD